MPQISAFFGILIYMYYNDHNPAHFHAKYGDYNVVISIENFGILEGSLPPKSLGMVVEWAALHKVELLENWELAKKHQSLIKIEPLN
ncbi:DUF4160 domain-containing protein [Lacihabitans sp. CCS-44]|jgi:hypothetical protein|uniref:DUF4160 domain-containing protein n=1 Tax=Lacihabitans sp. CCS-44 TaxID=2487331 RepID=UPI0020CC4946|nr:DUF4160 domain-containing protein [Lacihabitans sp. CCS-44]MCP9757434.1 DUF4160 domain-containing protein [Lacihabitans sp. CCS-44]